MTIGSLQDCYRDAYRTHTGFIQDSYRVPTGFQLGHTLSAGSTVCAWLVLNRNYWPGGGGSLTSVWCQQ